MWIPVLLNWAERASKRPSVRRVRRQKMSMMTGFIVTWDVDSEDSTMCARLRRFVFGHTSVTNGKSYRYPGFVELEGVRYLGQSVLFVKPEQLEVLRRFLIKEGIEHEIMHGSLGPALLN